jgi:hypothetical protein
VKRRVIAVAAVAMLLLTAIPAAAVPRLPGLLSVDLTNHFAVRPATVHFGADSGVFVTGPNLTQAQFKAGRRGHIRWVVWNGSTARGAGTVWVERCIPDCATGGFSRYPGGALQASRPRDGRYTRLLLAYPEGNRTIYKRFALKRAGGVYGWQ